ncbi:hypothetical protein [Candidatus Contubernalis alkaliaceticus]|uniref:hypothetical protein n=1 Tax=Candidatus Contubernalis alkaliaceticus TaxID=338645 RepID=UPI001F4C378D|nr:hypothetical protein [Candidatus Contubernalis alkalaceticus]UNC90604.1 hypothetical protein HUE98_07355 [Candidatus Contubernalis alkalaceticus]
MKRNNTSMLVGGLGLLVTGIGATLLRGKTKAGVVGFGLAHIVLGGADMLRQKLRH